MDPIYWLVLFAILGAIEIATLGLTTIWFAGGALISFFAALLGAPLWLQIIIFLVVSILLLGFTRPLVLQYFNKRHVKTNAESLEGQIAVVTEEINNIESQGHVIVNGQEWTARAEENDKIIAVDTKVVIISIQGVKLIVKEREE